MGMGVFTAADLEADASVADPDARILLAVAGVVYDVSPGARHYGAAGAYSVLARKDASRAFTTGDFSPAGLVDDLEDLSNEECLNVQSYVDLYENSPVYTRVGVLVGRHWSAEGEALPPYLAFEACVARGRADKAARSEDGEQCTYEFQQGRGSKLSCAPTTRGEAQGRRRVPRKFRFMQQGGGAKDECRCLQLDDALARSDVRPYPGCAPESHMCFLSE